MASTISLYRDFIKYCQTENYGFADDATCKKWIEYLANFLTQVKAINNMELPSNYKARHDPFFIVECLKYTVFIPEDAEGDMWAERWGCELVGYANLLHTLLCRKANIASEVPKWVATSSIKLDIS